MDSVPNQRRDDSGAAYAGAHAYLAVHKRKSVAKMFVHGAHDSHDSQTADDSAVRLDPVGPSLVENDIVMAAVLAELDHCRRDVGETAAAALDEFRLLGQHLAGVLERPQFLAQAEILLSELVVLLLQVEVIANGLRSTPERAHHPVRHAVEPYVLKGRTAGQQCASGKFQRDEYCQYYYRIGISPAR